MHFRLLFLHVFFWGEELVTVLCIVLILRTNAIRFVATQDFRVLVLYWNCSFELTLLLPVIVTDLRALHYLGEHAIWRLVYLLVRSRSEYLVNFKFQWFFFSFLIFWLFELNRLAIWQDSLLVRRGITISAKGGLVSYTWQRGAVGGMEPVIVRIWLLQSYLFLLRIEIWFWNEIQYGRLARPALLLCLYEVL